MITKFKIFEKLDTGFPKRGDYVVCKSRYWTDEHNAFLLRNIGVIDYINYVKGNPLYSVYYSEDFQMPNFKYGKNSMSFWRNEIIHWSDNREELKQFTEYYNDIFKYNL